MTRISLGCVAGVALAVSMGTANATQPSTKADGPDILASLDTAAYRQLSTEEMSRTVGTSFFSVLTPLLGTVLGTSPSSWNAQVTRSGPSSWLVTAPGLGRPLTVTDTGTAVIVADGTNPLATLTRSGQTFTAILANSPLRAQAVRTGAGWTLTLAR